MTETTTNTQQLQAAALRFREIDAALQSPGSPFELGEELVRDHQMQVFKSRLRSVRELLDVAAGHGDKEFLVFDGGLRMTFADHARAVHEVAAGLQKTYGVRKGDRVAVCGANSAEWVVVAEAALSLGAVLVAMNSWWAPAELAAAIQLTEPVVVVADRKRSAAIGDGLGGARLVAMEDVFTVLQEAGAPDYEEIGEDDLAVLMFTSGTSGRPKAAALSHRAIVGFIQMQAYIGARTFMLSGLTAPPTTPVVRLAVFPLFHVSGLGTHLAALSFGHTTVWPAGRFDPARVIQLTIDERITLWGGASTHVIRLLEDPAIDSFDPTQLMQIGIGGSASTPSLIARTERKFPHLEGTFSSGYGLTESGGLVSFASNEMLVAAADCVGPPLPTVQVRIVGPLDEELPEGEIGTVCLRSPILMTGYWRNPAADDATRMDEGWLRTEDFGRIEHGLLHIASRRRDLIIRGGENIYPVEVEDCLDQHPEVLESAVIGRESDEFGQEVHAVVVLRDGESVDEAELTSWCGGRLAYFKVPATFEIRTSPLPRNAAGKVLKHLIESDSERDAVEDPG